ncbi:MAG TPA: hypothetical protein PKM57_06470 [Kiritimatiellia bacterium]|nr:hypothetical protein [Kiritimatiellia bacterium]
MAGMFDNEKLDIDCPNCKGRFRMTVRDLKRPGAKCPKCGAQFDSSQFKRELDKVNRQIKDLEKNLGNITLKF